MLLGKFSLLQMAKHGSNNLAIWSHWTNNAGSVEIVEPFLFATVNGLVAIDKYFTKNMNSVSFSFLIFKICECFKSSKYHWFAFTERTMLTVFLKKICANPASFCLFHPFYQYNDKYSSRFAYIKAWMVSLEFEPGAAVWYAMVMWSWSFGDPQNCSVLVTPIVSAFPLADRLTFPSNWKVIGVPCVDGSFWSFPFPPWVEPFSWVVVVCGLVFFDPWLAAALGPLFIIRGDGAWAVENGGWQGDTWEGRGTLSSQGSCWEHLPCWVGDLGRVSLYHGEYSAHLFAVCHPLSLLRLVVHCPWWFPRFTGVRLCQVLLLICRFQDFAFLTTFPSSSCGG